MCTKTSLWFMALVAGLTASAKTVALWPLNWNEVDCRVNGTCSIDAANDLSPDANVYYTNSVGGVAGLGWATPPNLDSGRRWRVAPNNKSDVFALAEKSSTASSFANSANAGKHVSVTNNFTFEGWVRFPSLPASGGLFFVLDGDRNNTGTGNQRWFLTLRNNSPANSGVTWQIYSQRHNTGDAILATLSAEQVISLTNSWHHFALSLEQRTSDVIWRFYQDGVLLGSATGSHCTGATTSTGCLVLGGRGVAGSVFNGSLSYCRLSDKVLDPVEFLNYGDPHGTVALWRMDRTPDGGVNGAPSVGTATLNGGFVSFCGENFSTNYSTSVLIPDSDCAFTGNPPNPTVTLPNGNRGSLFSRQYTAATRQVVHDLGAEMSLTNDFTVEGWLKLDCHDFDHAESTAVYRHICGTRILQVGWVFQVGGRRGAHMAVVHVQDSSGVVMQNGVVGDLSACEDKWAHVALVYDHVAGEYQTGVWNCYVDGALSGSSTNAVAPRDGGLDPVLYAQVGSYRLCFGSMYSDSKFVLPGKFDCWRVSRTKLQPVQFMCTENGTAATDVLALWPMNAQNGAYIDGSDVAGPYTFAASTPAHWMATGCEDAPEVPGVTTAANGSVGFNVSGGGANSYLICNDASTVATLSRSSGSTFEVYLYRSAQPAAGSVEFVFIATDGKLRQGGFIDIGVHHFNLTYRATGFQFHVDGINGNQDMTFTDESGQPILLPLNTWAHMAFTSRIEGANAIFELYLDGVKKGIVTKSASAFKTPAVLFVGGRYPTGSSFCGKMSSLRVSKGALSSDEFLCANSAVATSLAYWPLDYASSTLDLAGRIPDEDGRLNSFTATSALSGNTREARSRVPNPDSSTTFEGDAAVNIGSVELDVGGYAQSDAAGNFADLREPFTVEGWLNWSRAQGAVDEVVAGTDGGTGGWKLSIDSTGAKPCIRIHAKGEAPMSGLVDGALMTDASSLEGDWHHLALRYDPSQVDGVWSLLVDGKTTGSVTNRWRPSTIFDRNAFRLGAFNGDTAFGGGLDMWRISRGVLDSEGILWRIKRGTMVLFR